MPPLPQLSNIVPYDDEGETQQKPTISSEPEEMIKKPDDNGVDTKIKELIQYEIEKLRKEFLLKLEDERSERLKLETELNNLKKA
jgi:hypothetical protein